MLTEPFKEYFDNSDANIVNLIQVESFLLIVTFIY